MDLINILEAKLEKADGVYTYKNSNTTIGFVRFNSVGEVEYIFVNPLFRKKKNSKKTFKISKRENSKKISFSRTN